MLNELIERLSFDSFNPELNFQVAQEYGRLGQSSSAVSFYLRAVEYGYKKEETYTYNALLKIAQCFDSQSERVHSVSNCLLQAIAYKPERPEAYYLLGQFYESKKEWQECYTWSQVGLSISKEFEPLLEPVGYPGLYALEFEKAVSAWWVGRKGESLEIFKELLTRPEVSEPYKSAIRNNLAKIEN
jgi:tetratricopeptide (TPR) repeat protein